MKQTKDLLVKFDFKFGQAIKQNKLPMVAYYYGKLSALFDLSGRTKENKELCPNWLAWNKFSRSMKDSDIILIYVSIPEDSILYEPIPIYQNTIATRKESLEGSN